MNLVQDYVLARKRGVPLLAITTPDQFGLMEKIFQSLPEDQQQLPILAYDVVDGFTAVNPAGESLAGALIGQLLDKENPVEALALMRADNGLIPKGTTLFFKNAHRHINADRDNDAARVVQAICNLRDPFKQMRCTLVMLAPEIDFPSELSYDVIVLDDPLPTVEELGDLVTERYEIARNQVSALPELTEEERGKAVEALRGLSFFTAENLLFMNIVETGINTQKLWEHKRTTVELTPGLKFDRSKERFDDLGGLIAVKARLHQLFHGPVPPSAIIWLDEIEKMMAGIEGDNTGVSQDALGVILTFMEELLHVTGAIFVGVRGGGKSAIAKATGNTFNVPTIRLDLGATKGRHVGDSEKAIRQAIKVIEACTGDRAFFIATCNKLDIIPPELQRRFQMKIWYFDLPTPEEIEPIWRIQLRKHGFAEDSVRPPHELWTGSDIRDCCYMAWRLNIPLEEAAQMVIPMAKQNPEALKRLRQSANGNFLSASEFGAYNMQKATAGRAFEL